MSMQELTDDQLDGLFRKSSEEFDPPPDPAAWPAMQTQLDTHDRTVFRAKLMRWGLPPLLLLLMGVSVWYATRRQPATENVSVVGSSSVTSTRQYESDVRHGRQLPTADLRIRKAEPAKPELAHLLREDESKPGNLSEATDRTERLVSTPETDVKTLTEPSRGTASGHVVTHDARANLTKTNHEAKLANHLGSRPTGRRSRPTQLIISSVSTQNTDLYGIKRGRRTRSENSLVPTSRLVVSNPPTVSESAAQALITEPASSEITGPVILPVLTPLLGKPGNWPDPVFSIGVIQQPAIVEQPRVSKPAAQRGLSVRFMVSPDLSTIGLHNFSRPGTNVGLLLDYRMASRWSVQAGFIQSTKVYKANTNEYKLPDYVSNWSVQPESVDGQCRMFDIPINLRYDLALLPGPDGQVRGRWFVSSGVTTYIMRQEDYTYNYADPTNPHIYPKMRGWSGSTGKEFIFSQLNLSAGYERTLTRRLSWQIEPFLKAPLRGVGYYKINLLSMGTFLSIRYKL